MNKYILAFTPDAFKQNFRNLLEDLEGLVTSIAGTVLRAGRSGGQQVAGGTAASEDLTLTSNATATKDRIFFGSAQTSSFDEVNQRIGLGTASPSSGLHLAGGRGVQLDPNSGSVSGRLLTLSGITSWMATTINASWSGSAWLLDSTASDGWFFKLDVRNTGDSTSNGLWLFRIPAGANPHTDEYAVFGVSNGTAQLLSTDLAIGTAGKGLKVKEGANATMGTATLVAGTVTVNTTAVTSTSRIFVFGQNNVGAASHGELTISARTAGTSFTILSSNAADTRICAWLLVNPA